MIIFNEGEIIMQITESKILEYKEYLIYEEKALTTIKKYIHDINVFVRWLDQRELTKKTVLEYKETIINRYAPASVNSILSSLNGFFQYCAWHNLCVKNIKIQKQVFSLMEKELSKEEYGRLLFVAKEHSNRLYLVMQTICSCGIRISELKFITTEAVFGGQAKINCKGKYRKVFLPSQLCKMLKNYIEENNIKSGSIFITKNGNPLDRSNIWSDMKKLCKEANVSARKVFPHNLRHLFARTYYDIQKDIVRLSDILGHANVNTTRIYTMESGIVHHQQIQRLGLVACEKNTT